MKNSVLVITHIESNTAFFAKTLPAQKFDLVFASSAEEATKMIKSKDFDIIFYDNSLPDGKGVEFISKIKLQRRSSETPVIFITVTYKKDHVQRAYNAGAVDFITKPLYEEEILGKLKMHFEVASMRRELQKRKDSGSGFNRLALALEHTAAGVFVADDQGRFVAYNKAFAGMTGYADEELKSLTINLISHPDDTRKEIQLSKQLSAGKTSFYRIDKRLITKSGEIFWADVTVSRVQSENGQNTYYSCVVLDHTELKAAELRHQDTALKFRSIFNNGITGIAILDEKRNFSDWNPAFEEMLGYGRSELLNMHFSNLTHPDDLREEFELLEEMQNNVSNSYIIEKRFITKSRSTIWVHLAASCIRDSQGKIINISMIADDITERKKATLALKESEQRYRSLIEQTDEIVAIVQDWRIVFSNRAAHTILGFSESELYGKPFLEIIHPDERDTVMQRHTRRLLDEVYQPYQVKIICRDGNTIQALTAIDKISWNNEKAFLIYITDLKTV